MYKSLLVPIDGSRHAQEALAVACHVADEENTTLYLLHIPEEHAHDTSLVWGLGGLAAGASEQERQDASNQLISRAAEAARQHGVTNIETLIDYGDPARTIVSEAKNNGIDAIVLGSRGLSNLRGLMQGSTSRKVNHDAHCTVITVHYVP